MVAILLDAAFVSLNQPTSQTMVQPGAQARTRKAWFITVQKTVKYCTYYERDCHTEDECHDKHPHLNKLSLRLLNLLRNGGEMKNLSKMSK